MNISKVLSLLKDLWSKHSPTVLWHIVLFVLIREWILDPNYIVDGQSAWLAVKNGVTLVLSELGFTVERGYVIAILILLYLTIIQWLAFAISRLPFLSLTYREAVDPSLITFAGDILRTPPSVPHTLNKMNDIVNSYLRKFRDRGEPEPYDWLYKQFETWLRYYGLSLLTLVAALGWLWRGSQINIFSERVLYLALIMLPVAFVFKWRAKKKLVTHRKYLRYAALYEYKKDQNNKTEPDKLRNLRQSLLRQRAEYEAAYMRHPKSVILNFSYRFPRFIGRFVKRNFIDKYLSHPPRPDIGNWELLQSQILKQSEEEHPIASALRVEAFKERFRALLECQGAGLCLLISPESGLAPSVPEGGSRYSFAARKHDYRSPSITYKCYGQDKKLEVPNYENEWGFLVLVGQYPIELLAQRILPKSSNQEYWWRLISRHLETNEWTREMFESDGTEVCGVKACRTQTFIPGNSYIYRSTSEANIETVIAFQCFLVGGTDHILIAWKILDVILKEKEPPKILPWWDLNAWKGLLKKRT